MSKLDKVLALIDRAVHAATPEEEARSAALQAVRIIHAQGLIISERETASDEYDDYDIPSFSPDDFTETVVPFTLDVAKGPMTCAKCGKEIRKGMNYAKQPGVKDSRVTHFECRVYFVEGQK